MGGLTQILGTLDGGEHNNTATAATAPAATTGLRNKMLSSPQKATIIISWVFMNSRPNGNHAHNVNRRERHSATEEHQNNEAHPRYTKEALNHIHRNRKEYAERHGYDTLMHSEDFEKCKSALEPLAHLIHPPAWAKLPLMMDCLRQYDRVVWIDADALIVNHTVSIDSLTNSTDSCHSRPGEDGLPRIKNNVVSGENCVSSARNVGISTGLWIVQNYTVMQPHLMHLLKTSHDKNMRNHQWWENKAAIDYYRESAAFKDNTCILPPEIMHFPSVDDCQLKHPKNFLYHWAGGFGQPHQIATFVNTTW